MQKVAKLKEYSKDILILKDERSIVLIIIDAGYTCYYMISICFCYNFLHQE